MSKAFLSHSSVQKPLIEAIAKKLGRDNAVVDKYNFEKGAPTLDSIIQGIEKTDLFVLFLSEEALESEWVQREITIINNLKNKEIQRKILVFVVDEHITHKDIRIPAWLREEYNLNPITDSLILFQKIDSKLRDISIAAHPYIKKKESIFVGRNKLMEEFEEKYYNIDNIKPSAIIVSGFEEVGRRKFILNALGKVAKVNEYYNPITISLDSRESIEDFILRLEDLNSANVEKILSEIKLLELEAKIKYAKNLLLKFQQNNEILFVLDSGSIVRPHKQIANWFDEIIHDEIFFNSTCVCVISKFRPTSFTSKNSSRYISFHVAELQPLDRQTLFLKYCELFVINPQKSDTEKVLASLNGMPNQIFYCAKMIKDDGIVKTLNRLDEVKKFNDIKVVQIIEAIKNEGDLFYNLLIFIAKFEFVSYDIIYQLFDRTAELEEGIDKLYVYGVYDRIGINKEYLQSHHAITEYVKRSKLNLGYDFREKLQKEIKTILLNNTEHHDLSQLLITVKSLLENSQAFPEKYLIPSFIIRIIQDHYFHGNYPQVEILAKKILDNHLKYDVDILREIRYILSMSYCRMGRDEFYNLLDFFTGSDYYFLKGFFLRCKKDFYEAERNFRSALQYDPHSQKTRREIVNVLVSQSKYSDALEFAEANYRQNNLNAFHIQGYFKSLVRKIHLSEDDKKMLLDLMEGIKISHDSKSKEILRTMQGEYEYFINKDLSKSIQILNEAVNISFYKNYPRKALAEIYNKHHFHAEFNKIKKEMKDSQDPNDED